MKQRPENFPCLVFGMREAQKLVATFRKDPLHKKSAKTLERAVDDYLESLFKLNGEPKKRSHEKSRATKDLEVRPARAPRKNNRHLQKTKKAPRRKARRDK